MIDLKSILCTYPNCLNSRATFRSILMDKYPNEKRIVNILTILVDCGIVHKIRNKAALDDSEMQKLVLQLETDYGIMPQYAVECVSIWANAFDIPINPAQTAVPAYEPIFHVPIAQSVEVVEGSQSDYKSTVLYGRKTLSKYIGIDEKIVTVPNRIDGLPVEAIGKDVFANCLGIEKIIIPEGITEIRDRAFRGCEALKEVNLPKGLQFIGERAFDGCKSLTEIHLPNEVRFIGKSAFNGCFKLRRIDLPNMIKVIEENCFRNCGLEEVLLPDNLIEIGNYAFYNTDITKIDIPASVKTIGKYALSCCHQLMQVLLHEGVETIKGYAFSNDKALCAITIPKSVTTIENCVFESCDRNFTIFCYAGSYGLDYARKNKFQVRNAAK